MIGARLCGVVARESTFPADDVPDRKEEVLSVLRAHDPVPVPVTTLYLAVPDKRALADTFARMEREGLMEQIRLAPDAPQYAAARAIAGPEAAHGDAALAVYRLTAAGRA